MNEFYFSKLGQINDNFEYYVHVCHKNITEKSVMTFCIGPSHMNISHTQIEFFSLVIIFLDLPGGIYLLLKEIIFQVHFDCLMAIFLRHVRNWIKT